MEVTPLPEYGNIGFYYTARCLTFDMDEGITTELGSVPTPYQREFTISLRMMRDARFYAMYNQIMTVGNDGDVTTFNNPGYAPVEPVWVINGQIRGNLLIERRDNPNHRKLFFRDVLVPDGDQIVIRFKERTVYRASDNQDYVGTIEFAESNWWDEDTWGLHPGVTTIRAGASGPTDVSGSWNVRADPAFW